VRLGPPIRHPVQFKVLSSLGNTPEQQGTYNERVGFRALQGECRGLSEMDEGPASLRAKQGLLLHSKRLSRYHPERGLPSEANFRRRGPKQ